MTTELPTGVTVRVEFPPRCPEVHPPSVPEPGPITVPVQGSLTAEQFAHIVATVTAKVIEELGGQPGGVTWDAVQDKPAAFPPEAHRHNAADIDDLPSGGGGAGIDDTTIGTDTTWSSQKTSDELAGKGPALWQIIDLMTGEEVATVNLPDGLNMLFYLTNISMQWDASPEMPVIPSPVISIDTAMPQDPALGRVYAVLDVETGVITFQMLTLGG